MNATPREKSCPNCGANLSSSHGNAPCSACLMQLGMQSWMAGGPSFHINGKVTEGMDWETNDFNLESLGAAFPTLEILHLIGKGGMGTVFCARQKSLDRLVALKVIKPEEHQRQDFEKRFQREAQALAKLNHPNIITVHDFGRSGDFYYFIMEYVDGINLRQMIRGEKQLSPRQALEIVPAVCDALQYAHDKGIVHRDIKPENILIDVEGKVHIADFGLAKLLDKTTANVTLTQANQVMGTMHYMAPEQFERPLDVDHRADIYSLGVVIYELLTGELPLGRFDPPSQKVTVDVRLDEIVLQTLAKEPAARYQRVVDVKSDLQSAPVANRHSPIPQANYATPTALPASTPRPPVKTRTYFTGEPRKGPMAGLGFLTAVGSSQSYKNWLFNLLSFPLGIIYFVLIIVGLSVGLGTLIIWIGILVLLGTFLLVRGLTALDKQLVSGLLNTDIPMRPIPRAKGATVMESAKLLAFNRETWLGVLYLIGKLPLGIISFVCFITSFSIPIATIAAPFVCWIMDESIEIGVKELNTLPEMAPISLIGFGLLFVMIHISNAAAWLQAGWARLCLRR